MSEEVSEKTMIEDVASADIILSGCDNVSHFYDSALKSLENSIKELEEEDREALQMLEHTLKILWENAVQLCEARRSELRQTLAQMKHLHENLCTPAVFTANAKLVNSFAGYQSRFTHSKSS